MAKTRKYWFWSVKKYVQMYSVLIANPSAMSRKIVKAIDDSLAEIKEEPEGELKERAVLEVLIKKTKTVAGIELEIGYSWRTIQNWLTCFVVKVGQKLGF